MIEKVKNNTGKVIPSDHLVYLSTINNEKYYLFKPTLFRVFPKSGNMQNVGVKEYFRFLLMCIVGCKVYVLTTIDDVVKGCITYSRGGGYRFPFATKHDLIDGPSYTVPEFRGQGVAVRLGDVAMNTFETNYDVIYGTIKKDNIASLKRVEKNGFEKVGMATYTKFHRAIKDENGEMVLVAYYNKNRKK